MYYITVFIIEFFSVSVHMHYIDAFFYRYTNYCMCPNDFGLFLHLQMNSSHACVNLKIQHLQGFEPILSSVKTSAVLLYF